MDGTTTASAGVSKNEILMVFHELMSMAKHMLEEVLPDVLLLVDNSTVETIIQMCEDFDGSLIVFKKICKIIAKKNLSQHVSPQSDGISVHRNKKQYDDSVVKWTAPVPSKGPQEDDDDHVWKTLLKEAGLGLNGSKKHQLFFYCGLCNVRCNDETARDAHEGGKNHKDRLPKVHCIKTKCDTCAFQLISDYQHVALIMASPEHISLDAIFHNRLANKTNSSVQKNRHEVMPEVKSDVRNASSRDVEFHGNIIVSHYVELTATLKTLLESRVEFTICCCIACNFLAKNKDQWIHHLKSPVHNARTSSKNAKNKMFACSQCDFGIIAYSAIALHYMCYHIERCHNQCTDDIIFEDYMVINDIPNPNVHGKQNSSNPSSFKGSADSLHLSSSSYFDDGPFSRPSSRTDRTRKGLNGPSKSAKCLSSVRVDSGRSSPFSGRSTPSQSSTGLLHENGRKSQPDCPPLGPGGSSTVGNKGSHERISSSPYVSAGDSRTGSAAGGNFKKPEPFPVPPSDELPCTKSPPQENPEENPKSTVALIAVRGFAHVASHGTSQTSVSKPHEGKYNYDVEHAYHGSWHGSAYPHGYGGLGDGHGSYGLGSAHVLGALPQGGHGSYGHGGLGGLSGGYGGYRGGNGGYGGYGHGATSSANFNLKSYGHGHGGLGGYGGQAAYGGYGHEATSTANFNLKSYGHGHGGLGGYGGQAAYGGYGHEATSSANFNLKSYGHGHGGLGGYGGQAAYGGYGHGATSSANFNLKSYGHGLGGYGGQAAYGGYGHEATSSANFNLKSYGHGHGGLGGYGGQAAYGGYGHGATSSSNFNLKSYGHGHGHGR